jgi:DTW domain-containing protein YfiP
MRSVVRYSCERCPRCQLPLRWCVCAALRTVKTPLQVDVLMHHREVYRPSSTGHLIERIMPATRRHLWRRERQMTVDDLRVEGREMWILHPQGEPLPSAPAPADVQVVLLDGSWREASAMAREVAGWGRRVNLPMTGESRFWLREQTEPGRFSTVEALMFLLGHFGLDAARATLALQLELHVYASLRARGQKDTAERYLAGSPIGAAFPAELAQLHERRPR